MKATKKIAYALLALALVGCSSQKETEVAPENVLLERSSELLRDENFIQSVEYLKALETRFPRTAQSEQTRINLIYAYFQNQDYNEALLEADRYFRHYKNSPYSDYVLYMAGLTREAQNKNWFQDYVGRDPANRDSFSMRSALENFKTLIQAFPNSSYRQDAEERMAYIYALLARHEMNIAKFYAKRKAWVSVANRVVGVQRYYPNTDAALNSLPLLKKAYEQMGLTVLADKTEQLIQANEGKSFPELVTPKAPTNIYPPFWTEEMKTKPEEKSFWQW